jgi:chromosome segregation ATPase
MARRKPGAEEDDAVFALAVANAIGGILSNIAQTMELQGASRQAGLLRSQREHLIEVLSQWQRTYGDLKVRLDQRERELEASHHRLAESRAEIRRQARGLEALGTENRRLHIQLSRLEAKEARTRVSASHAPNH